jgi:hypothetical protein
VGDKVFGERIRTRLLALLYVYVPVHVNDYVLRENDYVLRVNDYFPKAVRGTSPQRLATTSTLYDYTEQGPSTISMSNPRDNGAPVDSVNRPAFGYKLNLFCVILFEFYLRFNLNTSTCFAHTGSLIFVMNMLIISGIKMYRKLPTFLTPTNPGKVCKLQKSIYGLKKASRSWNLCFDEVVKRSGFIQSEEEPCVYNKASGSSVVFLILYVDDILLIGNDILMLEAAKTSLKIVFQ